MDTYLTYFDQFRYFIGITGSLFVVCHKILPEREHYRKRAVLFCSVFFLALMAYVPLSRIFAYSENLLYVTSVIYWIIMSLFPIAMIKVLWEATPAGIMFRAILGVTAENFLTAITYYLFVKCLFPGFNHEHPFLYLLLVVIFYMVVLITGRSLLGERVAADENSFYQEPKKTFRRYLSTYILIHLLIAFTKLIFESVLTPLGDTAEYVSIFRYLSYYLTVNLLLLSCILSFVMITAYEALTLRNEKQIIMQMARDRKAQYEFSKESMEMVRQQAHDLKHRIRALEKIAPEERRDELVRTEQSVDSFDAVFRTGHEALDTILTEKNIYCLKRSIRLSCNVRSSTVDRIKVVDLYTLLGNALDNAIEAVDKLADPEKKTISLTVRDQDEMLFLQVENYYEGSLTMEDGLPLTTKPDEMNHGFGTKSIRAIVKSYGGASMVRTEDGIYSLEILIPT